MYGCRTVTAPDSIRQHVIGTVNGNSVLSPTSDEELLRKRHNAWFIPRLLLLILLSIVLPLGIFLFVQMFLGDRYLASEPIHAVIETGGSLIVFFTALIFIINRQMGDYARRVWIASALIAISVFDLHHACTKPGEAFVWLHNLAVTSGGILLAFLFLFPKTAERLGSKWALPFIIIVATLTASWLSLSFYEYLPRGAQEGGFTMTAKAMNFGGGILFIIAGIGFITHYWKRYERTIGEYIYFAGFCFLFGISGLVFYQSSIWAADWWLWHLFRVIAYILIFRYVIVILIRGKDELQAAHDGLETHRLELERANERLTREIEEGRQRAGVIARQTRDILELSTPVMVVWRGIIVAPIIGTFDSMRTQLFMDTLLDAVSQKRARFALIDVTGVPVIDTQTGQHFIESITAVRLLGAEVILTGVRFAIAQTLVHLGINLSGIMKKLSLSQGLQVALDKINNDSAVI